MILAYYVLFLAYIYIHFGTSDLGLCNRQRVCAGLHNTRETGNADKKARITTTFVYSFISNASVIAY
jgi:hypothetical protein